MTKYFKDYEPFLIDKNLQLYLVFCITVTDTYYKMAHLRVEKGGGNKLIIIWYFKKCDM